MYLFNVLERFIEYLSVLFNLNLFISLMNLDENELIFFFIFKCLILLFCL